MTIHISITLDSSDLAALAAILGTDQAKPTALPISVSVQPPAAAAAPVAVLPAAEPSPAKPRIPHPHKGANRYPLTDEELRTAAIEQLRSMAVDGVAPTTTDYDHNRPGNLPTSTGICKRLKVSWLQLATEAGLVTAKMKEAGIIAGPFRSVNGGGQ